MTRHLRLILPVLLTLALMVLAVRAPDTVDHSAQASHDPITADTPGMDIGFDMITAGNGPAALGPIDRCVSVPVGETAVTFDIFIDSVVPPDDIAHLNITIGAKPGDSLAGLGVTAYSEVTDGINILTAVGTGIIITFSHIPPHALAGYHTSMADLGPAETGMGVMTRYTVDTTVGPDGVPGGGDDVAAPAGLYPMIISPLLLSNSLGGEIYDTPDGWDNDGDTAIDEDTVWDAYAGYGLIAIGIPCPPATDRDGDGYWNDDETVKGSDPFGASSTPEHCDGVDNDGDTTIDEEPAGANWDIDGDTVKDCLDGDVDSDGDGVVNTLDQDDDGDGFTDDQERSMTTDELGNCPASSSHDAYAPDRDHDGDVDTGDVIQMFMGKILNPAGYDARSDPDGDGDNDVGDAIILFFGKIMTRCVEFTLPNNTGGDVDDIHIEWSAPVAAVFSALDSELEGWSNRTLSGDGLTLDMDRPDGQGDLTDGGQLTIVVQGPKSGVAVSACQWTLDGVDQGAC